MLDSAVRAFVDGEESPFEENSTYLPKPWSGVWDMEKVDAALLLSLWEVGLCVPTPLAVWLCLIRRTQIWAYTTLYRSDIVPHRSGTPQSVVEKRSASLVLVLHIPPLLLWQLMLAFLRTCMHPLNRLWRNSKVWVGRPMCSKRDEVTETMQAFRNLLHCWLLTRQHSHLPRWKSIVNVHKSLTYHKQIMWESRAFPKALPQQPKMHDLPREETFIQRDPVKIHHAWAS